MSRDLSDSHIAILATDGFEQAELTEPLQRLREAGARVAVVSPHTPRIQGFEHSDKGKAVDVDVSLDAADARHYDARVIPGGLFNPDALRTDERALTFTRAFFAAGKPVAAICHGPWVLINAGVVRGRRMTSVPSIRKDLEHAGAAWEDAEVVVDNALVTSRTPRDLAAFCNALIEQVAEHLQQGQARSA